MTKTKPHVDEHQEAFELLPWLVNGTLDPLEHHRVQQHVDQCEICQKELGFLMSLQQTLTADTDAIPDPEAGLQSLMERIEQETPTSARASEPSAAVMPATGWWDKIQDWMIPVRAPAWSLAAVSLLVVGMFFYPSPSIDTSGEQVYRVLSSGDDDSGLRLQIQLSHTDSEESTSSVLKAVLAGVGGPVLWRQREDGQTELLLPDALGDSTPDAVAATARLIKTIESHASVKKVELLP